IGSSTIIANTIHRASSSKVRKGIVNLTDTPKLTSSSQESPPQIRCFFLSFLIGNVKLPQTRGNKLIIIRTFVAFSMIIHCTLVDRQLLASKSRPNPSAHVVYLWGYSNVYSLCIPINAC